MDIYIRERPNLHRYKYSLPFSRSTFFVVDFKVVFPHAVKFVYVEKYSKILTMAAQFADLNIPWTDQAESCSLLGVAMQSK